MLTEYSWKMYKKLWPPRKFLPLTCIKGALFVLLISEQAIILEGSQACRRIWLLLSPGDETLDSRPAYNPGLWAQVQSPLSPEFRHLLISDGFRAVSDACLVPAALGGGKIPCTELDLSPPPCYHFDDFCYNTLSFLRCLTPDAEARPDIVEVSSMISDVMMKYLDRLSTSQLALERKLERERRRTQRYFMEANRNAVTCHHELALLSQVTRNLLILHEAFS